MNTIKHLRELETEGSYVFHGSEIPHLEILEPRQAYTIIDGKKVEDDKPAVHASPVLGVAIFMALINQKNCPKGFSSGFDYNNGAVKFRATQKSLNQLDENSQGYVYVFKKDDFIPRSSFESISYNSVRPLNIVEVRKTDLPKDIQIVAGE